MPSSSPVHRRPFPKTDRHQQVSRLSSLPAGQPRLAPPPVYHPAPLTIAQPKFAVTQGSSAANFRTPLRPREPMAQQPIRRDSVPQRVLSGPVRPSSSGARIGQNSSSHLPLPGGSARYSVQPTPSLGGSLRLRALTGVNPRAVGHVDIRRQPDGRAYLANLHVDVEHRRQGVGRQLVEAALQAARSQGASSVVLEARSTSPDMTRPALLSMYGSLGFRQSGISPRGNPILEAGRSGTASPIGTRRSSIPTPPNTVVSRPVQRQQLHKNVLGVARAYISTSAPPVYSPVPFRKLSQGPMTLPNRPVARIPLARPSTPPGYSLQPHSPSVPAIAQRSAFGKGLGSLIQRKTNIDDQTWISHHKQTIAYQSGDDSKALTVKLRRGTVEAYATQKDLHHFCNGHLLKEFSFQDENINRNGCSTFWEPQTTVEDVKGIARRLLSSLEQDIEEKIESGGRNVVSSNTHIFEKVKYTYTITTNATENDEGDITGGTAQLEQFYPVDRSYFADKEDLSALKLRLGKVAL